MSQSNSSGAWSRRAPGSGGPSARLPGSRPQALGRSASRIRRWFLERGVLYSLTQAPMIALTAGLIFKWTTYPLATTFLVLPTVILLPVWVLYRRCVSDDPDEPANRFPRRALWAVLPIIGFDLVRIPLHFLLGTVFWGTWFDFGTMLTGQPNSHWSSLAAGTVLHIFQGYVLALGYYVLFRRVSLVSALTCLFLILAGLYSWLFPRYVILGPTPFKWFFVIWWAHLWFAIVAWAVPRADTRALQDFLHPPAHARTAVSVALVLAAAPFGFVFWRAGTWQFPRQDVIDRNAFAKLALAPENSSLMSARGVSGEVSYLVTFRLGPRDYSDFEGTSQDLALSAVRITGDVTTVGRPIAFCSASIPALPSGAAIATPASFSAIVRRSDYTTIQVECLGPAAALPALPQATSSVQIRWTATATLQADRDSAIKNFGGEQGAAIAALRP